MVLIQAAEPAGINPAAAAITQLCAPGPGLAGFGEWVLRLMFRHAAASGVPSSTRCRARLNAAADSGSNGEPPILRALRAERPASSADPRDPTRAGWIFCSSDHRNVASGAGGCRLRRCTTSRSAAQGLLGPDVRSPARHRYRVGRCRWLAARRRAAPGAMRVPCPEPQEMELGKKPLVSGVISPDR